ncbi:hypothetical protein FRB94_003574 [Tulasnella sp. JGI-2019a]|nr:hypothetical protein FRB94_003574 [Tulasnella sp. JGI-2019a]
MASFAQASFSASTYSAFRPTYPPRLIKIIYDYHSNNQKRVGSDARSLDLGCGTGQVTEMLPRYFKSVIGTDPSRGMIAQAQEQATHLEYASQMEFATCAAEEVSSIMEPSSVDLVTAGQAVHWFHQRRIWPEVSKVLKPGGTIAFWVYSEMRIVGHPDLTPLIEEYSQSGRSLGPFWQQPGRGILERHIQEISFPDSKDWDNSSTRRIHFAGDLAPELKDMPFYQLSKSEEAPWDMPSDEEFKTDSILQKKLTWEGIRSYLWTWSSLHNYHEKNPEDKERRGKGQDGDIADRFIETLRGKVPPGTETLEVAWPVSLMMIKKKA